MLKKVAGPQEHVNKMFSFKLHIYILERRYQGREAILR